jgi:hypothetical protein
MRNQANANLMQPSAKSFNAANYSLSAKTGAPLLHSFFVAVVAFVTVVLVHQFLLGTISYMLKYDTQITFAKVTAQPFDNRYWSSNRVVLMYVFPSAVFLFGSLLCAFYMRFVIKQVTDWYRFAHWCMVFSLLYVSAQFTLAPLGAVVGKGIIYQGVAVAANWWGIDALNLVALSFGSLSINVALGFFCFRIVMQLSPSRSAWHKQSGRQEIIRNYFLYPILLLLPIVLLLSYSTSVLFFGVMLLHSLLWLPGLFIKSQQNFRLENNAVKITECSTGFLLPAIAVVLILFVFLFL